MTTAVKPIDTTAAAAAEPVDSHERIRELMIAAANGAPVDPRERRELCYEVGWDKPKWDRQQAVITKRYEYKAQHAEAAANEHKLAKLATQRNAIRAKCTADCAAKVAELERQLAQVKHSAFAPLAEFDSEHAEIIEELKSVTSPPDYAEFMQRSADRRIGYAIGSANARILSLDAERSACIEKQRVKLDKPMEVVERNEFTNGERKVRVTHLGREHWQSELDAAANTLAALKGEKNPCAATLSEIRKAEVAFNTATHHLGEIGRATNRIAEIDRESANLYDRIGQLQAEFYKPENFTINFGE